MKLYSSIIPAEVINSKAGEDIINQCINLLRRSEKYASGRYKAEDLIFDCSEGRSFLWAVTTEDAVVTAACVVEFAPYHRKIAFRIIALGGFNMKYWIDDLHGKLMQFANDGGAELMEIYGRSGWERILAKYGYKKTVILLEVNLGQGQQAAN